MTQITKKHIAIFGVKYYPSRGGTSRVVESLLRHIKNDYEITIYCYRHPKAATNIPGVHTVQMAEPRIEKFGVFFFFLKCLLHLLIKGRFDLVHVHKTEATYFIPFIRLRYPVIATSHAIPYLNSKWGKLGQLYFRIAEWLFMYCGATRTSISKTQCDYYQKKYGRSVLHIPNGVPAPKLSTFAEKQRFQSQHQVDSQYLFFAARRIIPLKGCHHFIKALQLIDYKDQVVIAGDLSQMQDYSSTLIRQGEGLDIRFVDYIASAELLNALAKDAFLFIFPSEIEGMSMMLLEVAILGTPIICSDIPQNQAIFDNTQVLYFKSKDPSDLADKISYALANPQYLKAMAQRAKAHAEENYGIEKVVSQYRHLYDQHLNFNLVHEPAK